MQQYIMDIILSDSAARAICWTLVHSLWEGILAAVVAGIIISSTRRLSAAFRYNLLVATLLLFLLGTGTTWYYELRQKDHISVTTQAPSDAVLSASYTAETNTIVSKELPLTAPVKLSVIQRIAAYLDTHATGVTLVWLICLSVQMLWLTGGLYQVHRLRRNSVTLYDGEWNERLTILAHRLGIKKGIRLLQSGWVKTPATLGVLKPVILVPMGMLAQVPPDQVEAILLHELAHIRRGDYAANLFLHFAEALFFFNPGVRWIATLIRQEREACCDDMVLAGTTDRNSYFEALVAFTQLTIGGPLAGRGSLALRLDGGGKTDLLWRVRRMLFNENKKLQAMDKILLTFGLMVIVSIGLVSMRGPGKPQVPATYATTDTIPQQQDSAAFPADTGAYATMSVSGSFKIKDKVNFKSVSSNTETHKNYKKYEATALDDKGHRYYILKRDDKIITFKVDDALVRKEDYERYTNVLEGLEVEQNAHNVPPVPPVPPVGAPIPPVTAPPPPPAIHVTSVSTPAIPATPAVPAIGATITEPAQPSEPPAPPTTEEPPTPENPLVYTKDPNPIVKLIAQDLIVLQLITHIDKYSFTLDGKKLVVNGKKQPEEIFEKFKAKYVSESKVHYIYSQYYSPHGSGSRCEVRTDANPSSTDSQ